jgi:hypothetical protein
VYQNDTEILFPMRVAPHLRNLRGAAWRDLVDRASSAPEASLDQLAFGLLLVRLSSCLTCHTHSYRALRGCTLCATHTIRRFQGDDADLIALFNHARADVASFLEARSVVVGSVSGSLAGGIE